MIKKIVALMLFGGVSWAGGHNVNQEQNTVVIVNSQPGPQGPAGTQGIPGLKGPQGDPGQDYDGDHRLTTNIGADIQWYDWKHASIRSGYRYDFNHKGHVVDIGVLTLKLGKSYETRQLEALRKEIEGMKTIRSVIRGNQ